MVINLRRGRTTPHHRRWMRRKDKVGMRRYRVFLNHHEVTDRTFYVDSRRGVVRMFIRDAEGQIPLDPETLEPMEVERRGHVKLTRRKSIG